MSLLKKISRIDHTYSNFKRYVEIVDLIAKFGFNDIFGMVKKRSIITNRPERVRLLFEALGPTFVKLGQVISSRPDLIPESYVVELAKLQESVSGFDSEISMNIIRTELGKDIHELFGTFEHEPFAAASIGQVHHATLLDGTPVVVKVQRPNIEPKISIDLEIMYYFAQQLESSDLGGEIKFCAIVENFSHILMRELNYIVEATHNRRFANNMANQEGIVVPKVFMELTTSKVLTMEEVKGTTVSEILSSPELKAQYDLPLIAKRGTEAVIAQIYKHGFFHADPHPGNLFVMEGNRLCFIDFGMMGRISTEERRNFGLVLESMFSEDFPMLAKATLRLAVPQKGLPDMMLLERDLADLTQENLYLPLKKLRFAPILEELMQIMTRHNLALHAELFVMFKSLMTIESVGREFDPDLAIVDMLKKALKSSLIPKIEWRKILNRRRTEAEEWWRLGSHIPQAGERLIQKISNEEALPIKLEHHKLEPLTHSIDKNMSYLGDAIMISALLISSSVITLAGVPPKIGSVSILGVGGFAIAIVLSCYMFIKKEKCK